MICTPVVCSRSRIGILILSALAALLGASPAFAQLETWTTQAASPVSLGSATGAFIDGRLYVTGMASDLTGYTQVYDPSTNRWSSLAAPPVARAHASAVALNGQLYVVGGCEVDSNCATHTTGRLQAYDPDTNTWTTLATMPMARSSAAVGVIDGKLYVAGGLQACPPCFQAPETDIYDPLTDTWTSGAPIPMTTEEPAAVAVGGKLFVIGGFHWNPAFPPGVTLVLDRLQVYDPSLDRWVARAPMPTARGAAAVGAINGQLYVVGGRNGDGTAVYDVNERYDPSTDTWVARAAMPTARFSLVGAASRSFLYALGGQTQSVGFNTLEVYTPDPPTTTALVSPAPNINGWHNSASVLVTLSAIPAGFPVQSITYTLSGTQTLGPTTVLGDFTSFDITAEGVTTVTFHATDSDSNVESDKALTVRIDRTPPSVGPISNQTVEAASTSGRSVFFFISANDPGSSPSGVASTNSSPFASGDIFPFGTTHVTAQATDRAGNIGLTSFDVLVQDTTAPTMGGSGNMLGQVNGPLGRSVTFIATATDLGVSLPVSCTWPPSGLATFSPPFTAQTLVFPGGVTTVVTTVTCTATPPTGPPGTRTVTITVTPDTTAPTINSPGLQIREATGPAGAVVTFSVSAIDGQSGVKSVTTSPASGSVFPLGDTTVTVTAMNFAEKTTTSTSIPPTGSFTVRVRDTTAPTVEADEPFAVSAHCSFIDSSPAHMSICDPVALDFLATLRVTDAVDPSPTVTVVGVPPGNLFPLGETTVTVTATDHVQPAGGGGGNSATRMFSVFVIPPLASIAVTPSAATTIPGGTQQFNVSAVLVDGQQVGGDDDGGGSGGGPSPSWSIVFSPSGLSVPASCTGTGSAFTINSQQFSADSSGNVAASWSVSGSGPASLNVVAPSTLTAGTSVSLTLKCSNNAVIVGSVSATWNDVTSSFTGTFVFNGGASTGSVAITGWSARTSMPTARIGLGAGVVDNTLYGVGGRSAAGVVLNTIESFDPGSGTWMSGLAPMPTARHSLGVAVAGNVLFAIGGNQSNGAPIGTTEAYDPVANSWTMRAPMPTRRGLLGVATIGSVTYAVGGLGTSGIPLATVEAYDTLTNSWSTKASMPTPRQGLGVAAVNGFLLAIGGETPGGPAMGTVEVYDPGTDSWSTRRSMPSPESRLGVAVVNGVVYAAGGRSGASDSGAASQLQAYNPVTDTWTFLPQMLSPRKALAAGVVNNVFFAVGGLTSSNSSALGTTEAFSTSSSQGFGGFWNLVFSPPLFNVCNAQSVGSQSVSVLTNGSFAISGITTPTAGTLTPTSVSATLSCNGGNGKTLTGSIVGTADLGQFTGTYSATTPGGTQNGTFTMALQTFGFGGSSGGSGGGDGPLWTSNPAAIASVDAEGLTTGRMPGTATIAASFAGVSCMDSIDSEHPIGGCATLTVSDVTPPTIAPHIDLSTEATGASGAVVTYSPPSTEDDVDGAGTATCSPLSGTTLSLGHHQVTCSARDGAGNAADSFFDVFVQDTTPPTVTGTSVTVPATSPDGALASYTALATDLVDGAVAVSCTPPSGSTFPIGATTINCTATDAHGNSTSHTFTVTVTANQPPMCTAAVAVPSSLWPPNHKLVRIAINGVTDPNGDNVTLRILSIFRDEPTKGSGDGHTSVDGVGVGTSHASVRAERSGNGNGRVYDIAFSATDPSGASCSGTVTVGVHHDRGGDGRGGRR